MIVNGEQELTLKICEAGCKAAEIVGGKIVVIEVDPVVRWVQIEKCLCTIIFLNYLLEWTAFNLDGLEAFVS